MQNAELKLKELELETLLEITNSLLEFESVKELLQEILHRACSILDASAGFILTEEKTSDLFAPRAQPIVADIEKKPKENMRLWSFLTAMIAK